MEGENRDFGLIFIENIDILTILLILSIIWCV